MNNNSIHAKGAEVQNNILFLSPWESNRVKQIAAVQNVYHEELKIALTNFNSFRFTYLNMCNKVIL